MSDARDRAETRDVIEAGVQLASVSCGCTVAAGLIILGACAGAGVAGGAKSPLILLSSGIAAVVIVALVFLITRKTAKLKAARAEIEKLTRAPSSPPIAEPNAAGDGDGQPL